MSNKSHINFAFGSNLSTKRLLARLPNAHCLGVAKLSAYQLTFNMLSTDGSAKCTIEHTNDDSDYVLGVMYALNELELAKLDAIEGARYNRVSLNVETLQGEALQAHCYIANTFVDTQLPFDWYVQHVLQGAIEHGFPKQYIDFIKSHSHVSDAQHERAIREWQLHGLKPSRVKR